MGDLQLLDEIGNVSSTDDSDATDRARRDAIDRSIRAVLPDLTLAEIEQLDGKLKEILAARDPFIWVRHPGPSEAFHLVESVNSGAYLLPCNGSMPISARPEVESRPARADRCEVCHARYVALRTARIAAKRIGRGLAELEANAP